MKHLILSLCILLPVSAQATGWNIIAEQSAIRFSGTHAGTAFTGEFKEFSGDITFNPASPDQATASITVNLTSAATGDTTYDKTLPQQDWLNSEQTPKATFTARTFTQKEPGKYDIAGDLTLRDKIVPVVLSGTIGIQGEQATFNATTTLNRMEFGIGAASDPSGDWVSLEIPLEIVVVANRL